MVSAFRSVHQWNSHDQFVQMGSNTNPHDLQVKPSEPNPARILKLPSADQWMMGVHVPWLLCFRLDSATETAQILSEIEIGLSRAIDQIPLLAGKLADVDENSGRVQLVMHPDDHVKLSVRYRLEIDYEELGKQHFTPHVLDTSFVPIGFGARVSDVALALQANFVKGGLILACSMNHSVMDAKSFTVFLDVFSNHVNAVASARLGLPYQATLQLPPEILDRLPLLDNNVQGRLEEFPKFQTVEQKLPSGTPKFMLPPVVNPTSAVWHFSNRGLEMLKRAATESDDDAQSGNWISTNDALCALLWTRVCIAQGWSVRLPSSTLTVPFNIRPLMGFNSNLIANAVTDVYITSPTADLADDDGLRRTATRIRQALKNTTPEALRREWGYLDSLPQISAVGRRTGDAHVVITNLAKQTWFTAEWGSSLGGRLDRLRVPPRPFPGMMILQHPVDGLEVEMVQGKSVVEKLMIDEELAKYGRFLCRSAMKATPKTDVDHVVAEVCI